VICVPLTLMFATEELELPETYSVPEEFKAVILEDWPEERVRLVWERVNVFVPLPLVVRFGQETIEEDAFPPVST